MTILTADDIELVSNEFETQIHIGIGNLFTEQEAEALRQQILEALEFYKKLSDTNQQLIKVSELLELKDKAEKCIELEIKYGIQKIAFDGCKQSEQELEAQLKTANIVIDQLREELKIWEIQSMESEE